MVTAPDERRARPPNWWSLAHGASGRARAAEDATRLEVGRAGLEPRQAVHARTLEHLDREIDAQRRAADGHGVHAMADLGGRGHEVVWASGAAMILQSKGSGGFACAKMGPV